MTLISIGEKNVMNRIFEKQEVVDEEMETPKRFVERDCLSAFPEAATRAVPPKTHTSGMDHITLEVN